MERPSAEAPRRRRWGPPVADLPVATTPPAEAAPGDAPGTGRESTDHARLADPRTAISRDGGASTREGPATTTAPQSSGRPADEPTDFATASREKRRRRSRWDAPGDADAVAPGPSDRTDAGAVVPTSPSRSRLATPYRDTERRDTEFDIDVDTSKSLERTPHAGTLLLPGGVLAKLPVSFLCERDAPPDADEATRGAFAALARINRAAIEGTETEEDETRRTFLSATSATSATSASRRSPSPEPVYGRDGTRVNTRAARAARKCEAARAEALETVARLCASSSPASFRFPESYAPPRKTRKIFVPADSHPGYNFFGLIVGPRGNTQKQMQREFGVKIVIRGRGSEKKPPREAETAYVSSRAGEEEPMHVLVTGDDDASVDAAAAAVARLLEPLRDEENEHKRAQLRELAVLNGTLREDGGAGGARGGDDDVGAAVGAAALPPEIRARVAARYERDVARLTTRGEARDDLSVSDDATYRAFLKEVGVEAAPSSRARDDDAEGAASASAEDRRKTYVGGLPPFANEHTVALTFRPFGVIEKVDVVPDRDRPNVPCRGFAFVLFAEESAARAAATYFTEVASAFPHPPPPGFARADRAMDVRVKADPRPPLKTPRGDFPNEKRFSENESRRDPRCRLYVAKLAPTFSSAALQSIVAASLAEDAETAEDETGDPAIVSCDVVADRVTGLGRGFAFVRMRDARLAARVVAALDGANVEGRAIVVRVAEDKRRTSRERPEGAAGRADASGVGGYGVGGYASPLDPYARPGVYANPYAHYDPRAVAAAEAAVAAANPALAAAAAAEMAARAADPAFATGTFYSAPHLRGGGAAGDAASRPATAATAAPGDLAEAPPPPPS